MSPPPPSTSPVPETAAGRLVLVANSLDLGTGAEVDLRQVLPGALIERAAGLTHWVAENAKTTRAMLKRVAAICPLALPLQQIQITELPRPAKGGARTGAGPDLAALLAPTLAGHDTGLLSEAGLPAVADPGAALVAAAHTLGVEVEPWSGPSSLLMALSASGLNGQSFAFVGYLPVDAAQRAQRLRALEVWSAQQGQTQIAIETPYRNEALLASMLATLSPNTQLAVACGLTLPGGWCKTLRVSQWRQLPRAAMDPRLPAVFCWLAG